MNKIACILLFCLVGPTWAAPGWYPARKVAGKVHDYSVFEAKNSLYLATAHLPAGFDKNSPTRVQIRVHRFNGGVAASSKVVDLMLQSSPALFPVHPGVAVSGKSIMVVWQETNLQQGGTVIKYMFSEQGLNGFGKPQVLAGTGRTAVLPQLKVDGQGRFQLFFQQERGANRFTLMKSVGQNGVFAAPSAIVQEIRYIGRGVFFPSVVFKGNQVDVFYQNRLEVSLKDEIFRITSRNGGLSYGSPQRLMTNQYNDFSPVAVHTSKGLEWVWQANPNKNWEIYYSNEKNETTKITTTNANTYLPTMVNLKEAGNIIAWYDTRVAPPQVFGLFQNRPQNQQVGVEHNVSESQGKARKPLLARLKNRAFIFYLVESSLLSRQVDTFAEKIKVRSKTHPRNVARKSSRVKLRWAAPEDPSGIESYAYLVDSSPGTEPQIFNLSGRQNRLEFNNMAGGKYYLHILYRDQAGNLSPTSHYPFIINNLPPDEPMVSSDTHQDRIASAERTVKLKFKTGDDALVKRFHYVFSTNRAAALKQTTKENSLVFKDQEPNIYFFKVQAEDLSGKMSGTAIYQVEIAHEDAGQFIVTSNIADGRLIGNELSFKIISAKDTGIKRVMVYTGPRYKNPFNAGKELKFSPRGEGYVVNEKVELSEGLYTSTIGIEFTDGTRSSPRKFHFEKGSRTPVAVIEVRQQRPPKKVKKRKPGVSTAKKTSKISGKALKRLLKQLRKKQVKPEIRVVEKQGIKEVYFKIPKKYRPALRGYSWYLGQNPLRPDLKVNHKSGPVYLYDLPARTHWLSVRPIFADKKLNDFNNKNYSYAQIKVKGSFLLAWGGNLMYLFIGLCVVVVAGGLVLFNRDKVLFYLSRLRAR